MELHISSDDATYITSVYEFAEDNIDTVDGYVMLNGTDRNGRHHQIVNVDRSDVGEQFPKRLTFGQMLDMMKQAGTEEIYFQREDWRGTHNCLALNNSNVGELYIDIYYEDNRYAKGYEMKYQDGEVPIDCHPFIPTYADMFIHSWVVYKKVDMDYEQKENISSSTV